MRRHAHERSQIEPVEDGVEMLPVVDDGLDDGPVGMAIGGLGQVVGSDVLVARGRLPEEAKRHAGPGRQLERRCEGSFGVRRAVEGDEDVGERCCCSLRCGSSVVQCGRQTQRRRRKEPGGLQAMSIAVG